MKFTRGTTDLCNDHWQLLLLTYTFTTNCQNPPQIQDLSYLVSSIVHAVFARYKTQSHMPLTNHINDKNIE